MHVAAYHAEAGYNNDVPGAGVLCIKEGHILAAGTYVNSVYKRSNYAVVGHYITTHFAVIGGVVDGYKVDGGITPLLAGVVSIPVTKSIAAHVLLIPPVPNLTPATAQLSISWSLK